MAAEESQRESMAYDLLIVGGGPAGLAAAIRARQLAAAQGSELSVAVLEKGSEVGAHILSGAVIDPRGLDELIPDWRDRHCPLAEVPAADDHYWMLTKGAKFAFPQFLLPPFMKNRGNYTTSLGALCRWLAEQATAAGVEIFPGFPAADILYDDKGGVAGVVTGDMGVLRDGSHGPGYQPGIELRAKYTLFAEGARGHLTKRLTKKFGLRDESGPQVFGLGIKELWDVPPAQHHPGRVIHTQGWPLGDCWGGGFIYHQANNQVALGLVVALSYKNPWLSPYEEMQRWKTHPEIRRILQGGRRVSYGARVINEGGFQAVPRLVMPGAALIGCAAGFVNVPRIKGTHTAMKTGMLAAEAAVAAIAAGRAGDVLADYAENYRHSWVWKELRLVRNAEPLVAKFGATYGTLLAGMTMWAEYLGLRLPFTLSHRPDNEQLWPKEHCWPIAYPRHDGVLTFDRLSSVFLSNTNHREDQPCHLQLKDPEIPVRINLPLYDEPAQRYCPAGVYEIVGRETGNPRLQINAQNCIHCKACDIKDPTGNITWVAPEGGGGPNYPNM